MTLLEVNLRGRASADSCGRLEVERLSNLLRQLLDRSAEFDFDHREAQGYRLISHLPPEQLVARHQVLKSACRMTGPARDVPREPGRLGGPPAMG